MTRESDALTPMVSIVIPVYNGSNYLRQAIDSALAQDYPNVEIIVVDDGSNDEGRTLDIARSYAEKVRVIEKGNGGSSSALNVGLREMRGEYFSWLSHDDLYYPQKISQSMAALESEHLRSGLDSSTYAVICEAETIDARGRVLRRPSRRVMERRRRNAHSVEETRRVVALLTFASAHGCAYLIPRSALLKLGGFDEGLKYVNDHDTWFRLLSDGVRPIHVGRILVRGRMHTEQVTEQLRRSDRLTSEHVELMNMLIDWCFSHRDSGRAITLYHLAWWLGLRDRRESARLAFERSGELSLLFAVISIPSRILVALIAAGRTWLKRVVLRWALGQRRNLVRRGLNRRPSV